MMVKQINGKSIRSMVHEFNKILAKAFPSSISKCNTFGF
jgi:hypothetical protein